jgi:hypothetical protein
MEKKNVLPGVNAGPITAGAEMPVKRAWQDTHKLKA